MTIDGLIVEDSAAVRRANANLKDAPAIMVTTEGSKRRVSEAVNLGAAGYVRKPFTAEQIEETVSGLC